MSVTVTKASLLDLCNSIPNSGWIAWYFVSYTEKYVHLKIFTFL